MYDNEKRMIRLLFLDEIFSGRYAHTIDELVERFNNKYLNEFKVSKRTFYNDIQHIQDLGEDELGPIEKITDGKKVCYIYRDKSFTLRKIEISEKERKQLSDTLSNLSRFSGLADFQWLDQIITRFKSEFKLKEEKNKIIEFEENLDLEGSQYISDLYRYILNKQPLVIEYHSFNKDFANKLTFHPYFLKQFNNRWFAFGLNEYVQNGVHIQNTINIALDRIEEINILSDKKYIENPDANFSDRFDDIIGVTYNPDAMIENVKIRISNKRYPYIKTKPLHSTQTEKKEESNENFTIIQLNVQLNKELESLILSYGPDIEVLEPELLRKRIKNDVTAMYEKYQ